MSAYSVTEPFLQFVDRDGQPLEDGYVFIGVGGANPEANPITVYLDAALTTPLAQPIRTTNGYPTNNATPVALYVDASDYSVTLKDKRGALVVTKLSNVTMIPFDNTTGNISATRVVFQQTGSSVTRTLDSRLKESCSVFDFMTAAQIADVQARTFLFDVTAPIQAAINSGARDIYFPAGSYKVTSSAAGPTPALSLPNGVPMRLHGAGSGDSGIPLSSTVIKDFGNWRTVSIAGGFVNTTDVVVSDMAIQATALTSTLVYVDNTVKTVLERLWLQTAGFDGIRILNSIGATIRDVKTVGAPTANAIIFAENTIGCTVDSCYISDHAVGLRFTDNGGTRPRGHTVIGCTFSGSATTSCWIENTDDCRVYGCTFLPGDPVRHIDIGGALATPAKRNVVHGCTFESVGAGSALKSILVGNADDTTIDSCSIAGGTAGGRTYEIGVNAARTRLISNTIVAGSAEVNSSDSTTIISFEAGVVPGVRVAVGTAIKSSKFESSNSVPRIRFGDQRVWANDSDGNVYTLGSTPGSVTDGFIVGPGVESTTWAGRPTAPILGMVVQFTDLLAAPAGWNSTIIGPGGGINKYFGRWDGLVWRAT